jgi:hypothetical protein
MWREHPLLSAFCIAFCIASCEDEAEREEAKALGFRTYHRRSYKFTEDGYGELDFA